MSADLIYAKDEETKQKEEKKFYKEDETGIKAGKTGENQAKYIEMIEIDEVVMRECARHMRATAGDSMDSFVGANYRIHCEDCIPRLKQYAQEGKQFDVIVNDLTAIPCTLDEYLADDLWNFLKLILNLSMAVMAPDGHYFTQGNAKNCKEPLAQYERILDALEPKVYYSSKEVTVPSYQEQWMFYHIQQEANILNKSTGSTEL